MTYDRRGFGKSSQPTTGHNYDTFAQDLYKLLTHLKLGKFLIWERLDGWRRVARYIGKYGLNAVRKAVVIGGIPPFLLKTPDNPEAPTKPAFDVPNHIHIRTPDAPLHRDPDALDRPFDESPEAPDV